MKTLRKITAIVMAFVMLVGSGVVLTSNAVEKEEMYPSIVIPGLFQGNAHLYDESGNLVTNADGEELEAPFFLGDTGELVLTAVKHALFPLLLTLGTQRDWNHWFANGLGKALGEILLNKVKCDEYGEFINDVRPVTYNTAVSNLSQEDKDYIYDTIPLTTYKDIAGEDKLYFFSYYSFGNMENVIDRLYELIQIAKEETGYDKVNIVPISQGGSICNALLEKYGEGGRAGTNIYEELNRIIYVIPALDGSYTLGDIYYHGLLDDNDALYGYMFPMLLDDDQEWLGYLINTALRIFPNKVLNETLDIAVDILVEDYLENSTLMWGLMPEEYLGELMERYLDDPEDYYIRLQVEDFRKAQANRYDNILKAVDAGVEVYDIVNYNHPLYTIVDSWDDCQADGIIQLESTSMGAYGIGVDKQLPEGYVQQNKNTTCSDPKNHVHIDPYNLIDASTGLLPDTTFYFYNADHERTGSNDVVMKLVVELLTDPEFKNVYTYPDKFPQFNTGRNSKGVIKDVANSRALLEDESIDAATRARLEKVINEAQALIDDTACTPEEVARLEVLDDELDAIRHFISYGTEPVEEEDKTTEILTKIFKGLSDLLYSSMGGSGFVEIEGYNT